MMSVLKCPAEYGTHCCVYLRGNHGDTHLAFMPEDFKFKTNQHAPLSAYDPKRLEARHVLRLRAEGLIK